LFTRRIKDEDDQELEVFNGIRVLACTGIILGSTYFYMLKGPLQNMEVIQEWMEYWTFSLVLSAEHTVDIFFWLTAFIGSYFMLGKMAERDNVKAVSWFMIYASRVVRLLPLYMFSMFFFWKFLVLYGGSGPLFYQYHAST
jgi:peptidoglycan/LPS O-acetylase OafA/YrhL